MNKKIIQRLFTFFFGLFVFALPWQARWIYRDVTLDGRVWQYGRLSIYLSTGFLLLAAIFFALGHREQWRLSKRKWWYALVFYALAVCVNSFQPLVSLYYFGVILATLVFIFLAQQVEKKYIFWPLLFSGLFQGVLALDQILLQDIAANKWLGMAAQSPWTRGVSVLEINGERILRAYGSFSHPNILAGFLGLTVLVGLYLWHDIYQRSAAAKWQIKKIKKYLWSLILVVASLLIINFALLASFSRSGLLALVLVWFFMLVSNLVKKDRLSVYILIKYLILLVIAGVAFNMFYPGSWSSRFDLHNRLEAKSVAERVASYSQIDWHNGQNILFGQGLGSNTYFTYYRNPGLTIDQIQPAHNYFILAVAEAGIVGLLILLVLLYFYWRENFWLQDRKNIWKWSLVIFWLVISLLDHYFWTAWTGWLMTGAIVAILYKKE